MSTWFLSPSCAGDQRCLSPRNRCSCRIECAWWTPAPVWSGDDDDDIGNIDDSDDDGGDNGADNDHGDSVLLHILFYNLN